MMKQLSCLVVSTSQSHLGRYHQSRSLQVQSPSQDVQRLLDRSEPESEVLVHRCLEESQQAASNLPMKEMRAMKVLMKDQSIMILPDDKGRATVILDAEDYKDKMQQLLSNWTYQKLT